MECLLENDSEVSHLCCACCIIYRRFALRQVRQNAVFKRKRREKDIGVQNTKKKRLKREKDIIGGCALENKREYFYRERHVRRRV